MKLDKFDVVDARARPPGHGDSVSSGDIRIGGLFEDASQAAGRKQHRARSDLTQSLRAFIESHRAPPRDRPPINKSATAA